GRGLEPLRRLLRHSLLEEEVAAGSVDEALQGGGPLAQVDQRRVRGLEVVVGEVELRVARLREEDLVRVRQPHLVPGRLDRRVPPLAGNGSGFCGGYDLVEFAEGVKDRRGGADPAAPAGAAEDAAGPDGSALDPAVQAANHDPDRVWDPVVDFQMMSRNVRGFMSLFHSEKPVL